MQPVDNNPAMKRPSSWMNIEQMTLNEDPYEKQNRETYSETC